MHCLPFICLSVCLCLCLFFSFLSCPISDVLAQGCFTAKSLDLAKDTLSLSKLKRHNRSQSDGQSDGQQGVVVGRAHVCRCRVPKLCVGGAVSAFKRNVFTLFPVTAMSMQSRARRMPFGPARTNAP